ncbi:3-hydroxyisobutyrate dehydrogenase [Novosphingobium sp. CF614]|uniref:NAD(P)-dependent oxidoreductase n=1 Tax=Novosphingobium sp. CF614 TaxID=1884364 RepID=UPI0008F2A2F6|nr:NAD(P)-dependent oxidoreductase [Novosphingobium sp. CF614]SFF82739.1 3-hydroxyisobutyrate dehydrogenase [Novosphingobium sp. CF614]
MTNDRTQGDVTTKIGWIGLGDIGTRMVKRLLAAGYPVTVYPRGGGLDDVTTGGAKLQPEYARLGSDSDLLVVCVYDDAQVRSVLFDNGALAAMRPGSVLALHTTGSPGLMRELGEKAPPGVQVLDVTFSGGPADVEVGGLTLMVGGDADALERTRAVFDTYAARIYRVGALGQGQLVKLMNNLLLGANMMNAVELLRMAEGLGFDTTTVARIIQASSGASYAMRLFQNQPVAKIMDASRHYLEKDVAVALAAAEESGLDVSAFAATAAYYAKR